MLGGQVREDDGHGKPARVLTQQLQQLLAHPSVVRAAISCTLLHGVSCKLACMRSCHVPCLCWVKLHCAGAHIPDGVVRPRLVLPSQRAQYVASSQQLRHVRRCAVLHSLGAFYGRRWQMRFYAAGFALSSGCVKLV